MISDDFVLPQVDLPDFPYKDQVLSGLPRILSWRKGQHGPEYAFRFDKLTHPIVSTIGDASSNVPVILVIGIVTYEFAGISHQDEVGVDLASGALWRISSLGMVFLNQSPQIFLDVFRSFEQLLERLKSANADARFAMWLEFDEYLKSRDSLAYESEVSFWPDIIGEALSN